MLWLNQLDNTSSIVHWLVSLQASEYTCACFIIWVKSPVFFSTRTVSKWKEGWWKTRITQNKIGSNRAKFASLNKALLDTVMSKNYPPQKIQIWSLNNWKNLIFVLVLCLFLFLRLCKHKKRKHIGTYHQILGSSGFGISPLQTLLWFQLMHPFKTRRGRKGKKEMESQQ